MTESKRLNASALSLSLLLAALAAWHAFQFRFASIDDAYITYRYAENIASWRGYVFNAGEHVEGTSTFLFTLLLSLGKLVGLDIEFFARMSGIAAFAILVCVTFDYVRNKSPGFSGVLLAGAACFMLVSSTALAFYAAVGMELVPYILLLTLGVFGSVRNAKDPKRSRHWMLWLALAAATRTEALFLAVAILAFAIVAECWQSLFSAGRLSTSVRRLALPAVELLAVFTPLLAFRRIYFGAWVPNSVTAKSGFFAALHGLPLEVLYERLAHEQGVTMILRFCQERVGYLLLLLPLGLLLREHRRQSAVFLVVIITMGTVVIWNNGDWMPHSRLLVPLLPLFFVASITPLAAMRSKQGWRWANTVQPLVAVLVAAYGSSLCFYERDLKPKRNEVADYMLALGRGLGDAQQGQGVLATDMAGRVPYASRLRTLDMFGLCDLHIARYGTPVLHMGKIDNSYVYAQRPDFYFLNFAHTVRGIVRSPEFSAYANDYWVVATPFAKATHFRHGKVLLARKGLSSLETLKRQLEAELVDPRQL